VAKKYQRKGGVKKTRNDPDVEEWLEDAAENHASLTRKQRLDRERTRVRYDVDGWLKQAVERVAEQEGTSASQAGALLLAWSLRLYAQGDEGLRDAFYYGHRPSNTIRFEFDVSISREIEQAVADFLNDGPIERPH
jgi:hypothetical protein